MADFHQNGNIAQFHNLRQRPVEELVYEIESYAQTRKISLVLPSLFSELESRRGQGRGGCVRAAGRAAARAAARRCRRRRRGARRCCREDALIWEN